MAHMTEIARILSDSRIIAVVGLSTDPERYSYKVAQYMQAQGYRIVPVNPNYAGQQILGQRCCATLAEAALALSHAHIDIVACFRKPDDIPPIAAQAIAVGARCLWMQLDIVNEAAATIARAAGLAVVMDACLMVEHRRLHAPRAAAVTVSADAAVAATVATSASGITAASGATVSTAAAAAPVSGVHP